MKIRLSPQILSRHPAYVRYCIVARGVDNTREDSALKGRLEEAVSAVRESAALAEPAAHPRIASWIEALEGPGADPERARPSVLSLVALAREREADEPIAFLNLVVAIANLISLRHLVPCGADDLGLVKGDVELRPALGHELFVGLGSSRIEPPVPGELVLADATRALCRNWVWRQGVHTMVEPASEDVVIGVDVLPPVSREEGDAIAAEAAALLERACGGRVSVHRLDRDAPEVEFETPPSRLDETVYDVLEERGYIQQTSQRAAVRQLLSEGVTVYQGFDPTQPSLHVAHLMSLMVFHYLQQAGNRMIFILGGGTAQVGDPSGLLAGRPLIGLEDLAHNGAAIRRQIEEIGLVDFESALFLDNLEWLRMDLLDFAREITRHFSVNEMVKRDDFRQRLENNEPLSLFELLYTTLQGYDFLHLYERHKCVIQMGGNDQWINILDGADLIRRKRQGTAYAMTFPLLMDRTGNKMGKTAKGETIWLAGEGEKCTSLFDFYQYWVACPDEDLRRNFRLFTFLPLPEIERILRGHPRQAQHRLAYEVTRIVHGEEAAARLREDADRAFKGTGLPQDAPVVTATEAELEAGLPLIDVLVQGGLPSKSEARRRIQQGGVRVNGERVGEKDFDRRIGDADLEDFDGQDAAVIRFGKGKVVTVQRQTS